MQKNLLLSILSQPTAPFREIHVVNLVRKQLDQAGVPYFLDPSKNIVIGVKSAKEYQSLLKKYRATPKSPKPKEPLRIFMAHLDHPGFHGVEWKSENTFSIRWHGGSPVELLEGASVWIADASGWLGSGKLKEVNLIPSGRGINNALVESEVGIRGKQPKAEAIFGGFRFREPAWQEGDLIYTKGADDLVGSFAIVSLALDLWSKRRGKTAVPFLAILTRAEEVGFIGALAHLSLGWIDPIRDNVLLISLETSRTFPGAEIGKGPVVRLGDKTTVFDSGALRILMDAAVKRLPDHHQRRIMDGGTCEATAAIAFGLPAIGISIPLGNYHNQSFEGGPDSRGPMGPAPEFVHLNDVQGMIELCKTLLEPKLPWSDPWKTKKKELKKLLSDYRSLLKGI